MRCNDVDHVFPSDDHVCRFSAGSRRRHGRRHDRQLVDFRRVPALRADLPFVPRDCPTPASRFRLNDSSTNLANKR